MSINTGLSHIILFTKASTKLRSDSRYPVWVFHWYFQYLIRLYIIFVQNKPRNIFAWCKIYGAYWNYAITDEHQDQWSVNWKAVIIFLKWISKCQVPIQKLWVCLFFLEVDGATLNTILQLNTSNPPLLLVASHICMYVCMYVCMWFCP